MVATMFTEEKLKIPVFAPAYTDAKGRNVGIFLTLQKSSVTRCYICHPPALAFSYSSSSKYRAKIS